MRRITSRMLLLLLTAVTFLPSCLKPPINSLDNISTSKAQKHASALKSQLITVIIDPANPLDSSLRILLKQHWKYSELKFIEKDEVEKQLQPNEYVLCFLRESICFSSGKCYQGYAILKAPPVAGTIYKAKVITMVPCTFDLDKVNKGSLLDTDADFLTEVYIKRLQEQLLSLEAKERPSRKKGKEPATVYFNNNKLLVTSSKLLVHNNTMNKDSAEALGNNLGIQSQNIQSVNTQQMRSAIENSNIETMLVYEQQAIPESEDLGKSYYVYNTKGKPVAASTILSSKDRKDYRFRKIVKKWLIFSTAIGAITYVGIYSIIIIAASNDGI